MAQLFCRWCDEAIVSGELCDFCATPHLEFHGPVYSPGGRHREELRQLGQVLVSRLVREGVGPWSRAGLPFGFGLLGRSLTGLRDGHPY
jgi:hypothetical protein